MAIEHHLVAGRGEVLPSARPSACDETVVLCLVRSGRITLRTGDSTIQVRRRQAGFVGSLRGPILAEQNADFLIVTVPLELLHDGQNGFFDGAPLLVTDASLLVAPVAAFATQVVVPVPSPTDSKLGPYFIERLVQEMTQGLYLDGLRLRRPEEITDSFRLANAVIEAQCADPGFTAEQVASEVGLSLRQLERVFRRSGTSVARRIRRIRVERAARMLSDATYQALRVDDIAKYVGFSGRSSLARAMAAEGYATPMHLRRGSSHAAGSDSSAR